MTTVALQIAAGFGLVGAAATVVFADALSGPQFWALLTAFLVVGAICAVSLLLSPARQVQLFICLFSVIASMVAADVYIRFQNRSMYEAAAERARAGVTQRELVLQYRGQNDPAVPFLPPSIFLDQEIASRPEFRRAVEAIGGKVPVAGIANRTTVYCSEKQGYWTVYRSDRHGFNNPDRVWDATADIVAVGDSFTHGACVPPGKGMVDLVRDRFAATVNLGMAGSGPLLMLAEIREFGGSLKPRTVLWFFYEGNDLDDAAKEYGSAVHRAYLNPGFRQQLAQAQNDIDAALSTAVDALLISSSERNLEVETPGRSWLIDVLLLRNLRQALLLRLGGTKASSTDGMEILSAAISAARAELQQWGGQLCFVNLPSWESLFRPSRQQDERRQRTLDTVRQLGVHTVDLYPEMSEIVRSGKGDALFYYPGSHYSEFGYEAVATTLLRSGPGRRWACDVH